MTVSIFQRRQIICHTIRVEDAVSEERLGTIIRTGTFVLLSSVIAPREHGTGQYLTYIELVKLCG